MGTPHYDLGLGESMGNVCSFFFRGFLRKSKMCHTHKSFLYCTFKEDDDKPSDLGYEATLAVVGIKQKQPILGG
jgi:hypothetical protein